MAWAPGRPTEGSPPGRHGRALVGLAGLPPMCRTPAPRAWCCSGSLLDGCWVCGTVSLKVMALAGLGVRLGRGQPALWVLPWERWALSGCPASGSRGPGSQWLAPWAGQELPGAPHSWVFPAGAPQLMAFWQRVSSRLPLWGKEHSGGGAGIGAVGWRLSYEGFQRPSSASVIINGCDNSCGNFPNAHRPRAAMLGLIEAWLQPEGLTCPWGHRASQAHEA